MEKNSIFKIDGLSKNIVQIEYEAQNRNCFKIETSINNKISLMAIYYGEKMLFIKTVKIEIENETYFSEYIPNNSIAHNMGLTEIGIKECLSLDQQTENGLIEKIARNFDKTIMVTFIGELGQCQFTLEHSDKMNIRNIYYSLICKENKQ